MRIFLSEEITQPEPLPYEQIIAVKHYHQTKSTNNRGLNKIY